MPGAIRQPAVAGRFYPAEPEVLAAEVRSFFTDHQRPEQAIGCIVPHAGYVYSGRVAGEVFASIEIPRRCIVLCPNHTGRGVPLSIMSHGAWRTPLGLVPIDSSLASALKLAFAALEEDSDAHRTEHAIEVELPFLQMLQPASSFVPIALGTQRFGILEPLGEAIAEVISAQPDKVLIIASSDMNHYESDAITRVKDRKAIDRILALDAHGLSDVIAQEDISMCGAAAAIVTLTAAKRLGATRAVLIKYATSSDASGDYDRVVGYAGVVLS